MSEPASERVGADLFENTQKKAKEGDLHNRRKSSQRASEQASRTPFREDAEEGEGGRPAQTMRSSSSNVVSEASLSTRMGQWWGAVPFITAGLVAICGAIYFISLLIGYDSFDQICFFPEWVISKVQVYRIYTSVMFHASILHLLFNMLALVPIGSGLERILGSVRYMHVLLVVITSNGLLHLLLAYLVAHNPIHPYPHFIDECSIGFSGVIFAMIVMETSLSGAQSRSIFGLFTVPAKWYAWILLIFFQLLMPNVSLLGHLCGILSGFTYTYGLFNFFLCGSSTYSTIESSWLLASCVRRPGFIVGGGMPIGSLPSVTTANSGSGLGNIWRVLRSWMPQREAPMDERFPGRGRTLAAPGVMPASRPFLGVDAGLDLQARLLDRNSQQDADSAMLPTTADVPAALSARSALSMQAGFLSQPSFTFENQDPAHDEEALSSLLAMGFERSKAVVALAAANGDLAMAVEFLSSQG